MTLTDRINRNPEPLPDNVVPFHQPAERRAPQRWWERAKAGELYGRDENGIGIAVDRTGRPAA